MNRVSLAACLVAAALLGGLVYTQEATDKRAKDKNGTVQPSDSSKSDAPKAMGIPAKPAVHKVEKKAFKIELNLSGILAAEQTAPISYRPLPTLQPSPGQGPLNIGTIVEHGARVKKGDPLVTFDNRKLDEAVADAVVEKKMLETAFKLAEEELPLFQKSASIDLALAETAKQRADETLKYFLEIGRAEMEKRANFSVKSAKFYLETEQEELRQLQKMYKANDLTEDTEKIVLRRQEHYVEMAQFFYQFALTQHDFTMKYTLPRQQKDLTDSQVKQTLQLEKVRTTLEPAARQKEQALAKMRFDLDKNARRLEKLTGDRTALTLRSPQDGIAYHGKFQKGRWEISEMLSGKLVPGGTVLPEEVLLTVVTPRPNVVHLSVPEKDVHWLKPELVGKAKLTYRPERKLPARVTHVGLLPAAPEKFDVQVELALDQEDAGLMPGMACKVHFVPYSKASALVVPSACVHEEDDRSFVYLATAAGKQRKREVTTGPSDGEQTEILTGLSEGEEVLVERPKTSAGGKKSAPASGKGAPK